VPWLDADAGADDQDQDGDDDDEAIDLSGLDDENPDGDVDAPVTSGSDPTSWDPIDIVQNP
jgi:hypothetical protein